MKYFTILILFFATHFQGTAQGSEALSPEEKAYFFHIVRKSPILEQNLGRYLEYSGPDIRFYNKEINYDSIELVIMNQPEVLTIRTSEIAKSPKGLLAEAANKMALWELNKVLHAKRNGEKELEVYQTKYALFESILVRKLPQKATKLEGSEYIPHPKLDNVLNPSLSFDDKKKMIGTFYFLDLNEQLATLTAMNDAVNEYVAVRTNFFFSAVGGQANQVTNVLLAAGDGSMTSGLLEEREKDEKGRWNKGLPKAVGFFPYQLEIKPEDKKDKARIEPLRFPGVDFETVGNNNITNIHLDVWGYNAKKQTTVVIEKNGLCYHLFGSGETRFLSPDSSFASGNTFQTIINDLKRNKIDKLYEMIYGKKGFDYWIAYYDKKEKEKKLEIDNNEMTLSDIRGSTITTSRKVKKVKGNKKKRAIDTNSGGKTRKKRQELFLQQYNELAAIQKKIAELKKDKKDAIDLMAVYSQRLDMFQEKMGRNWATFTERDGLYTFQDSSTFDQFTQEFQFPASADTTPFEIRLIAIPYGALSNEADEVMLHIHVSEAKPNYNARVQLSLNDVFASDAYTYENALLSPKDSVSIRQFFEALKDKKIPFEITARGNGIGYWNGTQVKRKSDRTELKSYPGNTKEAQTEAQNSTDFAQLRKTELLILLDRKIKLEVNSFTDPVMSNLTITNLEIQALMQKNGWTKNDILSAYRTAIILKKFKEEINVLAGIYLDRESAKIIIDRFNSEYSKTRISIGKHSLKVGELF
jgi:hypothetical protein